jgi:hypothetical protein
VNYGPDPEKPLRSRLGPHADDLWQRQLQSPGIEDIFGSDLDPASAVTEATVAPALRPASVESAEKKTDAIPKDAPQSARRAELDNAIDQTGGRVGQWITDQQKRLAVGLDLLLAQLNEHRENELARVRAWEASERQRVETELAAEQDHFHERLMAELKAFEEQLALRLAEHEARLARWLAEAEQQAEQRFAAHRSEAGAPEGGQPTV